MKQSILALLLSFFLTGCGLIHEPGDDCADKGGESEFISLTFKLMVPVSEASRSDSYHEEIDSENPEFEDHIYSDDFVFYLFAGSGTDLNPDRLSFVSKVENATVTTDPFTNISGGPSTFSVKVSIPKTDFLSIVPENPEINDVTFRIVAFANTNKEHNRLTPDKYGSFANLIENASKWEYNIFGTVYRGTGGGNLARNPRIPMFGTSTFSVSKERLYKSRPDDPVRGENLSLLRSLAKFKVVDNISSKNGLPRIETVTITGLPMAYTLPFDAINYVNNDQIETARPCTIDLTGNLVAPRELNMTGNINEKTWIGYIPEQPIDIPKVKVTLTFELDEEGKPISEKEQIYEIPLTGYQNQNFDFGESILRNHIYTLAVDYDSEKADAVITAKVVPWTEEPPLNLDYSETVVVEKPLEWISGFQSNRNGTVILKEWSSNIWGGLEPVPLEGTFRITAPVGATWTAYLLQTANQNDEAFAFQATNIDGEFMEDPRNPGEPLLVSSVSGTITNDNEADDDEGDVKDNLSRIRIYPLKEKPSGNTPNRAILQIVVTIGTGSMSTVLQAPVTPSGITAYTIVQNP